MLIIQIEGGSEYITTAILNRIAFYPAPFKSSALENASDPQMKNLQHWYECQEGKRLEWAGLAENVQHNKRAISVTLRAKEN